MAEANEQRREAFWAWFFRSGRRDGATVANPRRVLSMVATPTVAIALYAAWVTVIALLQPEAKLFRKFASDPLFVAGIVAAFALMRLRYAALDYMAFSIYTREHVQLLRGDDEGQLRQHYEAVFGRDKFFRVPELAAAMSVVLVAVFGVAVVFLRL